MLASGGASDAPPTNELVVPLWTRKLFVTSKVAFITCRPPPVLSRIVDADMVNAQLFVDTPSWPLLRIVVVDTFRVPLLHCTPICPLSRIVEPLIDIALPR